MSQERAKVSQPPLEQRPIQGEQGNRTVMRKAYLVVFTGGGDREGDAVAHRDQRGYTLLSNIYVYSRPKNRADVDVNSTAINIE